MIDEALQTELKRCIGCKVSPCTKSCPMGVSPHDFIALALKGQYQEASQIIRNKNPLAHTCGLICPDTFCQKSCIRGKIDSPIKIPCLQAKIMELSSNQSIELPLLNGKKIAIIGGGPAGLGACWELIKNGYHVTIFEKENKLGGAIRLIPDYRLPKEILDKEIAYITNNDHVSIKLNHEITDFEALNKEFDNIILALGEQTPHLLRTIGEEHATPYKSVLLSPKNHIADKICVVGGGEVALDCALSLKKLGCQTVEMFVRRRKSDMRIMKRDFDELISHNIIIRELTSIINITKETDNSLTLTAINNEINSENKASPLSNTEHTLSGYNKVITALGSSCCPIHSQTPFLSAGDMTGTTGTVVEALASGVKVAKQIIEEA